MQKTYIGEVISSEIAEFTDDKGEFIRNWKLAVALNEEKCMVFYISSQSDLFQQVQDAVVGMHVKCLCEPKAKLDGNIKWRLVSLEQA